MKVAEKRKFTAAQRKQFAANAARARAALAEKRARGEPLGKGKGTIIPLDAVPALRPIVQRKVEPRNAREMEALGELIAVTWLALVKRGR